MQVDSLRGKVSEADRKITREAGKAEDKLASFSKDSAAQFEKTKKETGKSLNENIDKFDRTVEKKTSEAKSGISSWFGFGK